MLKNNFNVKTIVFIVGIIIVILGVGTSIYMNFVGRGLWLDEAMLAYSFTQRNLINLTTNILELNQSAPIGYLYIVKVITLLMH